MNALRLTALPLLFLASCAGTNSPRRNGIDQSSFPGAILGAGVGGLLGMAVDSASENDDDITGAGLSGSSSTSATVAGTTTTDPVTGETITTPGSTNTSTTTTLPAKQSFFDKRRGLITGAASGLAASMLTQKLMESKAEQMYAHGYAKAKSDAIKDFYWLQRDAARPKDGESNLQRRYYEVPVPGQVTSDGVRIEPHRRIVEIVE
jgi:hypothetical protein